MVRRYLSEEDIDTIVKLRQSGAGWLKIEGVTAIPRRTAKLAFEKWQRSHTGGDLSAARRQVAAKLFQSHMKELVILAELLVNDLGDPDLKDRRDGTAILNNILLQDIHVEEKENLSLLISEVDSSRVMQRNRFLLAALKEHTQGSVDWQRFDAWLEARNTWAEGMDRVRSEVTKLVNNSISEESRNLNPASTFKQDETLVDPMVRGVVETIYRAVVNTSIDQVDLVLGYVNLRETAKGILILFSGNSSSANLVVSDKLSAEKAVKICRAAVANLLKGNESTTLKAMIDALHVIRESRSELVDKLDELRLTPLILRTRCELCPA